MSSTAIVVFLPGIAADRRLFSKVAPFFPDAVHPKWLPPMPQESLSSYACRMVENLPPGDVVLVGFSFGGILALHMAPYLRARMRGLVSVSSCRTHEAVPASLRKKVERMHLIPDPLLAAGLMVNAGTLGSSDMLEEGERQTLTEMASRANLRFIRWASTATHAWRGGLCPTLPAGAVRQIHGEMDAVIPLHGEPEVVVKGGGHLLVYTHPEVLVEEIRRCLQPDTLPISPGA